MSFQTPSGTDSRSTGSSLVHIVDPDAGICEALSAAFGLEGVQTRISTDARGFYRSLLGRMPDAVVCAENLGGDETGMDILQAAKRGRHRMAVVLILDAPHVPSAVTALRAGAIDVFVKPLDHDCLVRSVCEALARPAAALLVATQETALRVFSQLTRREAEVLGQIASGQTNKEAGRKLGISPRTVEVHRARLMEKLGAKNTADLMRLVLDR